MGVALTGQKGGIGKSTTAAADAWALSAAVEVFEEARNLREVRQRCVLITRKQGRMALGKGARAVLDHETVR